MNFGQNLWNWFSTNAQPLVLLGIACMGLYIMLERKASKLVGFVFFTTDVKDLFGNLFNQIFK